MLDKDALTASLKATVELYTRHKLPAEHRKHLGASLAGRDCTRYLWNTYRWLLLEQHDGRMRRLFDRGQREEQQFIDLLRGAGWQVWDIDPRTGKQYRITHMSGHIGGSLDAIVQPPGVNMGLIGEFKTHNQKSFDALKANGLLASKPEHFIQMSMYGEQFQLPYGLYCAVNKNTDEIDWQVVELDWGAAKYATQRLEAVIGMQTPPSKLSETPTHYVCKRCHFNGICHKGEAPEKNCRSCEHASPAAQGEWHCNKWQDNIPDGIIPVGCDAWKRLV
jgi:hypothetical protein